LLYIADLNGEKMSGGGILRLVKILKKLAL